jgi:hypothetical protein
MTTTSTHARENATPILALAFAGIAAYAGYRAIDAERRLKDPEAKPLFDHIVDTAKSDLRAFCDKASEIGSHLADEARDAADGAKRAAKDAGTKVSDTVAAATDAARDATGTAPAARAESEAHPS